MKTIKLDDLKPDPLSAAQASTDKETVTISGYICAVDKTTISVSENRNGTFHIECPRSAVIAAFTNEETEQVTLLVEANAQVKTVSTMRAEMIATQAFVAGGVNAKESLRPEVAGNFDDRDVIAEFDSILDLENTFDLRGLSPAVAQGFPGGPSTVPSGYGVRCRLVPYWVCDANGCGVSYSWYCVYYPLPRLK